MKTLSHIFLTALIAFGLSFSVIESAEAKRFGGGKSFGGKSSFSSPFKRSTTSSKPALSPKQQQAQQTNATQRANLSQRGGLMGMLGGLALGGLLGAMFFGGAFENFNFMDFLVIGGLLFLGYKLLTRRKSAQAQPAMGGGYGSQSQSNYEPEPSMQRESQQPSPAPAFRQDNSPSSTSGSQGDRGFDTDLLFDKDNNQPEQYEVSENISPAVPAGFDTESFLKGSRRAYELLQQYWDEKDIAGIRMLTTDSVFADVQDMIRERDGDNRTELLKIHSELLEVREIGNNTEATVLFDVLMREIDINNPEDARAEQVREVWHFTKPTHSQAPTWHLDGIQQLDD